MRGPHHIRSTDWTCVFCNKHRDAMPQERFELCSRAPEFTDLPRPGQTWFMGTGYGEGYGIVTHVAPSGSYRTGACVTARNIYTFERNDEGGCDYGRVATNWPPRRWRLIQDVDINPWNETDVDRIELLLEA